MTTEDHEIGDGTRLRLVHDLCEANGVCERIEPKVFQLSEEDELLIDGSAAADPSLRPRIELAARRCPRRALELVAP